MPRLPFPLACCLLLAACGGSPTSNLVPPPPPPNAVATVIIKQAPQDALEAGTVVQLGAEARNATGGLVTGQIFSWSSSAPAVATVSSVGRLTAVSQGTTTITVSAAGVSGTAGITVTAPVVLSIGMFPATMALAPAGSGQFSATAIGANGVIPAATIQWSSANPGVATVDASGRVSGVAPGTTLIRARVGQVIRTRGVTVSNENANLRIHRADFIQVAQNAQGTVELVRGKPTAVRIFPVAATPGFVDVPIDVTIRRGDAVVFATRRPSGAIPLTVDIASPTQGVLVPLPTGLDVDGATLEVTIDPDGNHPEADEWDNTSPVHGDDAAPATTIPISPLRVRLVAMAPAGGTPPAIDNALVADLTTFMRLVYPVTDLDVSVRSASIVTSHAWPDRAALSDALATLEIERLADGFSGHYYGVHAQGSIAGIAGLGYLSARSSLGIADGVVFAHEVGHNLGLGHVPGCGADNVNTAYPYPNGQIGIRGWDPRTPNQFVPATAIDMMGYCGGFKWISGGYFSGILSVLRNRPPGTLRAAPGHEVPFAIQATWGDGAGGVRVARRLSSAAGRSETTGAVQVQAVDAGGQVLATTSLPRLDVADVGDDALRVAGIVSVPADAAPRITAFWLTARGATIVLPVTQ